jgi:hypothetical protein
MTAKAPQPEYIITEEQMERIRRTGVVSRVECIFDEIRSRPHPTVPEHLEPISQIKCFYCGQICTPEFRGVFRGIATCPECIEKGEDTKEARTEAARAATLAERERLLKAAHEINSKRFCPSMVDTQYHCCDVMVCLDEIFDALRQQAGEQG